MADICAQVVVAVGPGVSWVLPVEPAEWVTIPVDPVRGPHPRQVPPPTRRTSSMSLAAVLRAAVLPVRPLRRCTQVGSVPTRVSTELHLVLRVESAVLPVVRLMAVLVRRSLRVFRGRALAVVAVRPKTTVLLEPAAPVESTEGAAVAVVWGRSTRPVLVRAGTVRMASFK